MMEMHMRCDACRYWQMAETDWQAERVRFRRCEAVKEQWHITSAATAQISYPHRPFDDAIKEADRVIAFLADAGIVSKDAPVADLPFPYSEGALSPVRGAVATHASHRAACASCRYALQSN